MLIDLLFWVAAFFSGAFAHRLKIKYQKKPEPVSPRLLKIGDHVRILLDDLQATGVFLGWIIQVNVVGGPRARVYVDQAEGQIWLLEPKSVIYLRDGTSTINLKELFVN